MQNWISFIFIQLQLKGILAKRSSPRTKDLKYILDRFNEICISLSLVIHCYMFQFQTAGVLWILIEMLRYFTDTQIGIQTAYTKKSDSYSYFWYYTVMLKLAHCDVTTMKSELEMSLVTQAVFMHAWTESHLLLCLVG